MGTSKTQRSGPLPRYSIGSLRNRTAVRLRTAEWRKNVARDCAFLVLRDLFIRHSAVLSLTAVLLRKVAIRHLKQQTSPAWRRQPETWHFIRDYTAHVPNVVTWRCPEVENVRTWGFTSRRKPEYFDPFMAYVCAIFVPNQGKLA